LKSLSDGALDARASVRKASTLAFSRAILDKHATIVPPGVMVNIFTEIYIPTIFAMASNITVEAVSSSSQSTSLPTVQEVIDASAQASNVVVDEDDRLPTLRLLQDLLISATFDSLSEDPRITESLPQSILILMTAVSHSFSSNLVKLRSFPTFDKLWLRLLQLFSFFLEEQGPLSSLHDDEVVMLVTSLRVLLHELLGFLLQESAFAAKKELWDVTTETLTHFTCFEGFVEAKA